MTMRSEEPAGFLHGQTAILRSEAVKRRRLQAASCFLLALFALQAPQSGWKVQEVGNTTCSRVFQSARMRFAASAIRVR